MPGALESWAMTEPTTTGWARRSPGGPAAARGRAHRLHRRPHGTAAQTRTQPARDRRRPHRPRRDLGAADRGGCGRSLASRGRDGLRDARALPDVRESAGQRSRRASGLRYAGSQGRRRHLFKMVETRAQPSLRHHERCSPGRLRDAPERLLRPAPRAGPSSYSTACSDQWRTFMSTPSALPSPSIRGDSAVNVTCSTSASSSLGP
jgi:hypothetical protein